MKNNKGFTLIEIIAVIVLIAVISLIAFLSVTAVIKNNKIKQLKVFSDNLTNAAEVYMTDKKDDFSSFNNVGDITIITSYCKSITKLVFKIYTFLQDRVLSVRKTLINSVFVRQ